MKLSATISGKREREKAPYEHRVDSSPICGRSHSSASPWHRQDRGSTSTRRVLRVSTPRTYASGASPFPSALSARVDYAPNWIPGKKVDQSQILKNGRRTFYIVQKVGGTHKDSNGICTHFTALVRFWWSLERWGMTPREVVVRMPGVGIEICTEF